MRYSLHRAFRVGVWIKGIDGFFELVGGLLFLAVPHDAVGRVVMVLTQHELGEDPHDVVATALRAAAGRLTADMQIFAALYLLAHGVVKVFLAIELLRGRRWAYLPAIIFLCLFISYQVYRLTVHWSVLLLLLACLDAVITALIAKEYAASRKHGPFI
jgi:uncharacterized membrane protein